MRYLLFILSLFIFAESFSQDALITNFPARKKQILNGKWQYIIDPYGTGVFGYRLHERNEKDKDAYWNSDIPENKSDRKEFGYSDKYSLHVPGDWNSQDPKFLYYEGIVWYKKSFDAELPAVNERKFLYFGAVNYQADVYLNGHKLGMHKGGFTPFNFEIPEGLLKSKNNFLVVRVDNKRYSDEVPTVNTDWWNFGGITRDVALITVPKNFIRDYFIHLSKTNNNIIEGWVKLNEPVTDKVSVEIPVLNVHKEFDVNGDSVSVSFPVSKLQLWSPKNPRLYKVIISSASDRVEDKIGFRTIEVKGKQILLNGQPVFLRGVAIHEEIPQGARRAYSYKDALHLLGEAKELNCNMVRLAHYPHNENMTRVADSLGILVWSEIPIYWTIDFENAEVLQKAKTQLNEMITRDRNRASIIIWSVGNETPVNEARTKFMSTLVQTAKQLDQTRLVSAALNEVHHTKDTSIIDDPLGQYTDLVSVNEYLGWYGGKPSDCRTAVWKVKYDKPLFFSETGAEALGGYHGDSLTMWTEEYQEWYYKEQMQMMKRMPDNFVGLSPWILNDFRSPRRNNPVYQEGWNNKGLFDQKGRKKKAFYVLKAYYDEMEKKNE